MIRKSFENGKTTYTMEGECSAPSAITVAVIAVAVLAFAVYGAGIFFGVA